MAQRRHGSKKAWLKEALRELLARDASQDVIAIAKAKDENSGPAPSIVFTILDHPDRKLTLTEKSSKTISNIRDKALGPRFTQTTTYTKHLNT